MEGEGKRQWGKVQNGSNRFVPLMLCFFPPLSFLLTVHLISVLFPSVTRFSPFVICGHHFVNGCSGYFIPHLIFLCLFPFIVGESVGYSE